MTTKEQQIEDAKEWVAFRHGQWELAKEYLYRLENGWKDDNEEQNNDN